MSAATGTKKRSFKSNIQSTLQKWKVVFKKITEETLTNLEENDISNSDNKKIEALFNSESNNKKDTKNTKKTKRYQFNNDNKKSMTGTTTINKDLTHFENETGLASLSILTPPTTAGAPELKITDEETGSSSMEKLNTGGNTGGNTEIPSNSSNNIQSNYADDNQASVEMTFDEYDVVKECEKLRKKTKGPFYGSESIWQTRRNLWAEVVTTDGEDSIEHTRDVFKAIPEQYYYRVYKKLVMEDKPLREPLNLEDAMKVINSGWMETKTWDNAAKGVAR